MRGVGGIEEDEDVHVFVIAVGVVDALAFDGVALMVGK